MHVSQEIERAYVGLQPSELWRQFSALNRIPRPSGQEERVRAFIQDLAESSGAAWESDEAGNTVVRVEATNATEGARTVAVQSHLDMVCDKDPGVEHDFSNDAIRPRREGDCIYARGTTLGADNGIGAAAALALLTTPGLQHGPLELLFTVDEERGLRGALLLDPSLLTARLLINLDSQDPSKLVVGSAGAQDTLVRLPVSREAIRSGDDSACSVVVSGLRGGHSGMDIGEHRANSLKLLAQLLKAACAAGLDFRIASLSGGTARNAIPHSARADVVLPPGATARFQEAIRTVGEKLERTWSNDEPGLAIQAEATALPGNALAQESSDALVALLEELPHGALAILDSPPNHVKTSANLGLAEAHEDRVDLLVTSRSFSEDDLRHLQTRLSTLSASLGAQARITSSYPPWLPESSDGELVSVTRDLYEGLNGRLPAIELIHAGLECGVIAARLPGLQAISFGPLIRDAHTPREHVYASTVPPVWMLLVQLLERLASDEQRQPS